MRLQKIIATIAIFALLPVYSAFAAFDLQEFNQIITDLQNTVSKYAETIKNLQNENAKLKKALDEYKNNVSSIAVSAPSSTGSVSPSKPVSPTNAITPSKASNVDKYNKLIDKINASSQDIFSSNNVGTGSSIGLFEFIEPSSFFISIDDNNNPAGEYAFKKKILYSYDSNFNLKVAGIFDLDFKSGYYKTVSGSNPFAKATRVRVKNPAYNGKLLTPDSSAAAPADNGSSNATVTKPTTPSTTTPSSATPSTGVSTVTLQSVKDAYNKNKILDALKLSTEYIKADPNNIDVTKIRYRSFYILGKYADSLAEVQKIETLIGLDKMEKVVACDAKTIAKLAKNADLNKRYADACAKK